MQILYINNNGAGFANYIDVPHGMTAGELFEREMRQAKPADYLIRVDSRPAARDQVLVEGNRDFDYTDQDRGGRLKRSGC